MICVRRKVKKAIEMLGLWKRTLKNFVCGTTYRHVSMCHRNYVLKETEGKINTNTSSVHELYMNEKVASSINEKNAFMYRGVI